MKWPKHFPKDCPPEDRTPNTIVVYRLVHSPILPEDFLSLRERYPEKRFSDPELECQACGHSVFSDVEDVRGVKRRVPRLRNRVIGVGTITTPEMGILKPTPSKRTGKSHCTWWVPDEIKPWKLFQFLVEA